MKQLLYVACAAALLLAGCGGGNNTPVPKQQPQAWTIQAGASDQNEAFQALAYYPAAITIDAGDSITWKYPAGEPHTVTFLGPKLSRRRRTTRPTRRRRAEAPTMEPLHELRLFAPG